MAEQNQELAKIRENVIEARRRFVFQVQYRCGQITEKAVNIAQALGECSREELVEAIRRIALEQVDALGKGGRS